MVQSLLCVRLNLEEGLLYRCAGLEAVLRRNGEKVSFKIDNMAESMKFLACNSRHIGR